MKKGTISIVFGWILVAMQIMALMGSNLDSGFAQMGVIGLIGYFLPGILGILLLCKGYKKRSRWQEEKSDTKPETLDMVMKRIRAGLTGDPSKDRAFLNNQIQSYRNHPLADEIIGSCAKLLANTLSDDELNQWGQAMKADDERLHSHETQNKQTVQREDVPSSEETETECLERIDRVNAYNERNLDKIRSNIALLEKQKEQKNGMITMEENGHPDGSGVVSTINQDSRNVEIHVFNADGECVERVYGSFEPVEPMSEEEFDAYVASIDSKYR